MIKANLVFVPVGADGKVRIFNFQGSTDVVADVVGYMEGGHTADTRIGRVVPLTSPFRTFDTRDPQFGGVALGPGQAEDWSFAEFAGSVFIGSESVGPQLGVIGNLTAAELKRQYATVPASSFLTAYPASATPTVVVEPQHRRGPTDPQHGGAQVRHQQHRAGLQPRRLRALPLRRLGCRSQRLDWRHPTG